MNIVEICDFCFAYPDSSKRVLDHTKLKIKEGTLNIICGRSGCGKSTLLRHLKTALAPYGKTKGEILYKGKSLAETDHRTQSQEIGFVMQNPDNQIVTDKVWHELAFGLESLGYDSETIRLRVAEMAQLFWHPPVVLQKCIRIIRGTEAASESGCCYGNASFPADPG